MTDPFQTKWLEELNRLSETGRLRSRRCVIPLDHGRCELNGCELLNFSSNDYLDLRRHAEVIGAAQTALREAGMGAGASALISGRTAWHSQLEQDLAEWEETEAALLFPSGYAANLGTLTALAGPDDTIFCERSNHASLIDGCRLSGARLRVFRHDRLQQLDRHLGRCRSDRRLIVTDSVFSMDGTLAPLEQLTELAESHGALLVVDEAHATGVYGPRGNGLAHELGLHHRCHVRTGTLSKSLGTLGGFVCGSAVLIDLLFNRARSQFFSTALPPSVCAAAAVAIRIVAGEAPRRTHLRELAQRLRGRLRQQGWSVPGDDQCPIVPVVIGPDGATHQISRRLFEQGIFVPAILPPTVANGTARLRISLSSGHTGNDIQRLIDALGNARSSVEESL